MQINMNTHINVNVNIDADIYEFRKYIHKEFLGHISG